MAHIVCSDDIKQELPAYDPARAEAFHAQSTERADRALGQALKNRPEKKVILMSGGSASGKSEYVSAYLSRKKVIVSDGTSSNTQRIKTKMTKAMKADKKVEIHAVWPADFQTAFSAFLNRDRRFPDKHFYRTHAHSRRTLLEIARNFPDVPITLIFSDYYESNGSKKIIFSILTVRDRPEFIEYLRSKQYTERAIKALTRTYDT